MSTLFSAIYPAQRTLLGDTGNAGAFLYSTAVLDQGIRTGLLADATMITTRVWGGPPFPTPQVYYYEDRGNPSTILPDFPLLTDGVNFTNQGLKDLYRLSIRATLAIVEPAIGITRSRTPVSEISRNQSLLIANLRAKLMECTDENVVVGGLSDLDNWLYGYLNFLAKMQGRI